jgi:hypothetical protein
MSAPSEPSASRADGAGPTGWARRGLRAFGRFWWEFLVGDTPELFVAMVVIVGLTALLAQTVSTTLAWAVFAPLVVAALTASVLRAVRKS